MASKKKDFSDFYKQVFDLTRQIPKGRVSSYGAISRYLSIESASRMVGYALQYASTQIPHVPAHRVVNRVGLLTGKHHFGGDLMQELLENEGVDIEYDKVVNFKELFWDPSIELT